MNPRQPLRFRVEMKLMRAVLGIPGVRGLCRRYLWTPARNLEDARRDVERWLRDEAKGGADPRVIAKRRVVVEREYRLARACLVLGDGDGHCEALGRMLHHGLALGHEPEMSE